MASTYTEREVAQIIERAVVRQEEARRRQGAAGLSLEEIERLGREVGIDPEHLRQAAAELDAGAGERESHTTATHNHVERWTTGPLDPIAWEDLVEDLRHRIGTDYGAMYGRTSAADFVERGATKTWEHTSGLGVHHRLTVSERGERTRIRLEQQVGLMSPPAEAILYGIASMLVLAPAAGGLAALLFNGAMATTMGILLGLILFVIASFAIYKADVKWRAKKMRGLEDLAGDIATTIAAPPEAAHDSVRLGTEAEGGGRDAERPLLDLDALDVTEADPPHASDRRRDRS